MGNGDTVRNTLSTLIMQDNSRNPLPARPAPLAALRPVSPCHAGGGRYDSKARYSTIVSPESNDETVDFYTPISGMVDVQTEIVE
jgi:hypothetical protein